jgi:hypothetical protein
MLVISTIYFAFLASTGEKEPMDIAGMREIIEKKLLEEPDANRKLVVVYAGTGRVR